MAHPPNSLGRPSPTAASTKGSEAALWKCPGMTKRKRISPEALDASLLPKQTKPIPHAFVLDAISALSPYTRPMFGCLAIYHSVQHGLGTAVAARPLFESTGPPSRNERW